MGLNGLIFEKRNNTAQNWGAIHSRIFQDGILSGCGIRFTSGSLTIGDGYLSACGRITQIDGDTTVEVTPTLADGYVRLKYVIDLTQEPSASQFSQGALVCDFSATQVFPALTQEDINTSAGSIYEMELCKAQITAGNITAIVSMAPSVGGFLQASGGRMSGTLTMISGVNLFLEGGSGLFGQRFDGTTMQLIGLGNTSNDNLYVGSTSTAGTKHTGNTYVCTGAGKELYAVIGENAYPIYHEGNRMKTKLLWSGSWKEGGIDVPGLSDYRVFCVDVATAGTGILAVKETDYFRGGNLYTDASGTTYLATIAATVNGERLVYQNCHTRSITSAGVVGPGEAKLAVAAIYGVI